MQHDVEQFYIGTTRFTEATWKENRNWREKHKWKGCIYGLRKQMPRCVPPHGLVFVIEMNNDTNLIMGIGLVRNYINKKHQACVYYNELNYNRYIYNSQYRCDSKNITDTAILTKLELMLFKGAGHYKRGQVITTIGWHKFKDSRTRNEIRNFLENLFHL